MPGSDRTFAPVDAVIRDLLARPITAAQLQQDAPSLQGLPVADAERVRGHLLASFESRGIADDALDIVAEELRTSASPIVLAGAARAVRSIGHDGCVDRRHDWAALLRDAAERVATSDVYVRWQAGVVAPTWMCTARAEILGVLGELPSPRDTDPTTRGPAPPASVLDPGRVRRVRVEDQSGTVMSLAELLSGRTTVLAFFYTRCMNPAKCSLTITRLAALASATTTQRPRILAMSYDPEFDVPSRLRRYGSERGFAFGESARFVRAVDGWQELRGMLGLRVGYGPVTVNEHARELFRITPELLAYGLDPDALADPLRLLAEIDTSTSS